MIKMNIEDELECFEGQLSIADLVFNERQAEWARMLWQLGDEAEFLEICQKSPSPIMTIMAYRRYLHNNEAVTVKEEDLYKALDENDDKKLCDLLQRLFLESIPLGYINFLHRKMDELKIDLVAGYDKLYQMQLQNKGKRFMYLVNSL